MDNKHAEQLSRSLDDFTRAVGDLKRMFEQFTDYEREAEQFHRSWLQWKSTNKDDPAIRIPNPWHLGEELSEEEAAEIASKAIHEERKGYLGAGGFSREPVTDEEAEEWVRRREERRQRQGYEPS